MQLLRSIQLAQNAYSGGIRAVSAGLPLQSCIRWMSGASEPSDRNSYQRRRKVG